MAAGQRVIKNENYDLPELFRYFIKKINPERDNQEYEYGRATLPRGERFLTDVCSTGVPLFDALKDNNLAEVERLVGKAERTDNLDVRDVGGWNAYFYARSARSLELLHEAGLKPSLDSEYGYTPLHLFAGLGMREESKKISELFKGLILQKDNFGRTPIMWSVSCRPIEQREDGNAVERSDEVKRRRDVSDTDWKAFFVSKVRDTVFPEPGNSRNNRLETFEVLLKKLEEEVGKRSDSILFDKDVFGNNALDYCLYVETLPEPEYADFPNVSGERQIRDVLLEKGVRPSKNFLGNVFSAARERQSEIGNTILWIARNAEKLDLKVSDILKRTLSELPNNPKIGSYAIFTIVREYKNKLTTQERKTIEVLDKLHNAGLCGKLLENEGRKLMVERNKNKRYAVFALLDQGKEAEIER